MKPTRLFDKELTDNTDRNINLTVPWFLMAAYAYYVQDDPILSDSAFDRLCRRMLERWDDIEHIHKHLISKDELYGGTYLGEYPKRVEGAIESLKEAYHV